MHIVLIRHGTRIDKNKPGVSPDQSNVSLRPSDRIPDNIADIINQAQKVKPQREEFNLDVESSSWLSNFDPPLNQRKASEEMDSAFKKISTNILGKHKPDKIMIHSSPYNRCIQTSELLLDKIKKSKTLDSKVPVKLRVDQALSEWLNENYNLKYLPPNDDGYSMINNVNAYLNQEINENDCEGEFSSQTRHQLRDARDFMWSYNQLGHCGEYGESASSFTRRCFYYLIYLLQFYYTRQDAKADRNMVVFIVSHGAVISTLLQILLGRSVFNEIPLCTPIYFKQSEKRRSVFKLMDYDFNLYQLLSPSSDQEFYKILDTPIELTKLDPENLRSELTIGTTGYTTIIQSIPKKPESTQKLDVLSTRRRRNTINIGDKEHHEDSNQSLKQTLSSRQLYRLNKDTNEEKVIDLDKLHSYFGGDSESDSDEEVDGLQKIVNVNDFDDHGKSLKNNIYKGSITSLSSFNEENKSKFQLNDKNFYSKQSPIESDPYSHFFLERSSTMEHNGEFDSINMTMSMSRKSSQGQNANVKFDGLTGSDSDRSIDTEEYESDSGDEPILSFGTKDKIQNMVNIRVSDESNKENTAKPYITGTFGNVPLKGGKDRTNSVSNTTNAISSTNMGSVMGCSNSHSGTKLAIPKLISTRNMNLLVRGGDSEESMTRTANNSNSILKNLLFDQKASPFGEDANSADDDDDDDEDSGWFGGFSR